MQAFLPFAREGSGSPNDFKQIGVGWVEVSFRHSHTSCAAPPGRGAVFAKMAPKTEAAAC